MIFYKTLDRGDKMQDDTIPLTDEQKRSIGRRIRQSRIEHNYTIEELASQIKMSAESLQRMEEGDFELYKDSLSKTEAR